MQGSSENATVLPTSLQTEKKTTFRVISYDVILSWRTAYWKGHPLWLLSHWEPTCHAADMTLFECSVYMWSELQRAPQMTKWLEVSKQPTNRLSSSRQEAGSSRGAALSHLPAALAASPPHHSNHVWWCAQLHAGRLFWFQPVWHICCLSRCVVPVCEPSATGANVLLILPSVFANRAHAYKQASMVHIVRKVRRPYKTLRAPVPLVSQAINPAANVWCVGRRMWVLCIIC